MENGSLTRNFYCKKEACSAAMSLNFNTLATLIAEGAVSEFMACMQNPNLNFEDRDENGQTLLMLASHHGHLDIVHELLRHGLPVDAEDEDNWTALLNASKQGHVDVIAELLQHGASAHHRDMGGWTALMWACYKGRTEAAQLLLEHGASPNVHDQYHISCLIWAAGRGHLEIARKLIAYGAKVNVGDKYGTTPLVWAARKGHLEIVEELLKAGANVDTAGMYSWTALNLAARGNYVDIVECLLLHRPNVNAVDMDGYTALTIACREGYTEIAVALLNAGAYVNLQDRHGDTNLIHATKNGHFSVVDALLKKYADVDIPGADKKTALYWAVEKGYTDIVKSLLNSNPNLELATKDGDTALLKATRNRNIEIVQILVDKKAKVSAVDRKGDTALHIAMRARSKGIIEILLRNPRNSQLLYRPNRDGETPYNIDTSHQKSILAQIFGARRLNTNEDSENMLGYDLYSSALADILSEPSLSVPVSVGLYARWGSGKSFLLNKLEDDMRSFAIQWLEPTFTFTWLVFGFILTMATTCGLILALIFKSWVIGCGSGCGIFLLSYVSLFVIQLGNQRYDWMWAYFVSVSLMKRVNSLKTLLQVVFCHPPACRSDSNTQPVRFLFTNQTKVSSAGGDTSVAHIVISLYSAIEKEYGYLTSRLHRVFKPKTVSSPVWKWRRLCCIPNFIICLVAVFSVVLCLVLLLITDLSNKRSNKSGDHDWKEMHQSMLKPLVISLACVAGVIFMSTLYTWVRVVVSLVISPHRRIQQKLNHVEGSHLEGYVEVLKVEVENLCLMAKCIDGFVNQQTRLVIIVDGLDSCEQEKVLRILDAVHLLFSDPGAPFVTILAIDPHIIMKAIESNIHRVLHTSFISGHDYLRNIVHLPFYLQNSGLRRVKAAQQAAIQSTKRVPNYWNEEKEFERTCGAMPSTRKSSVSSTSIPDVFRKGRKGTQKLKASDSVASSISNLHRMVTGAQDLTKVLLTDDYFSDVNPRSMRRLMNIIYVTGRLLKAFNIDFNWYHLASWVNIAEQWPYRTSWIIVYYELHDDELEETMPLKAIYEKTKHNIPTNREMDFMLNLDHDERKFEVFLSFHSSSLLVNDLKVFLPFTISLDPFIRKMIQEEHQQHFVTGNTGNTHHPVGAHPVGLSATQAAKNIYPSRPLLTPYKPPDYYCTSEPRCEIMHGPHGGYVLPQDPHFQRNVSGRMDYLDPYGLHAPITPSAKSTPKLLGEQKVSSGQKLSCLSVEGVAALFLSLENVDKSKLKTYSSVLAQQNINGQVLFSCDLSELKSVLKMSFGDWELFRMLILGLREQEYQELLRGDTANATNGTRGTTLNEKHIPHNVTAVEETVTLDVPKPLNMLETADKTDGTGRRPTTNSIEKQITMEESMICGALETLNEEAQEDAMEEEKGFHRSNSISTTATRNNILSPILSDQEEPTPDDAHEGRSIANTIMPSFSSPAEINVLYLQTRRGSPAGSPASSVRPCSPSMSAPEIEWMSSLHNVATAPADSSSLVSLHGSTAFSLVSSAATSRSTSTASNLEAVITTVSLGNKPRLEPCRQDSLGSPKSSGVPTAPLDIPSPGHITSFLKHPENGLQRGLVAKPFTQKCETMPPMPKELAVETASGSKKHGDSCDSLSSDSSNCESGASTKKLLTTKQRSRNTLERDEACNLNLDDTDNCLSDDEHTPLMSPTPYSGTVECLSERPWKPSLVNSMIANNNTVGSPTNMNYLSHDESTSSGNRRRLLERQFSIETAAVSLENLPKLSGPDSERSFLYHSSPVIEPSQYQDGIVHSSCGPWHGSRSTTDDKQSNFPLGADSFSLRISSNETIL